LLDEFLLRVIILHRFIGDLRSFGCIVNGTDVLIKEPFIRSDTSDHERVGVASKGLSKKTCELRVSVRNVLFLPKIDFSERTDDLSESEQGLVDIDALLGHLVIRPGVVGSLASC
jgi:hypothetical protein